MIALDTNVLIRFLIADDKTQAAKAKRLIRKATNDREDIFLSDIVLCELVWVLSSGYKKGRKDIVEILRRLLGTNQLIFNKLTSINSAVDKFEGGKADFSDYLIAEHASEVGCDTILTFDKALLKETGFEEPR